MELLSIAVGLGRAIGLCNLRYDSARNRFDFDHGPMLVYCMLLNLIYLVAAPWSFIVILQSYFLCQGIDILSMAFTCVSLAMCCSLYPILGSIWLRRQRIRRICNGYLRLMERFEQYNMNYSYWRRHFWKLLISITRFVVLFNQLFGPSSAMMCGDDDEVLTAAPLIYLVLSVAVVMMELVVYCTDSLAHFLLGSSNRMLECLSQEAVELTQDLRWLPQSHGRHRLVYQRQLLAAWQRLWNSCRKLEGLLHELLKICEGQMLLNVFSNYLAEISMFFNMIILIADSEFISLWRCYFYSALCILYHFDILMHFSIFSANQVQWKCLAVSIQQLWLALKAVHLDEREDKHCVALERQVEFAIIDINRKLQPQPRRIRKLQIYGLFDINKEFWNSMNASIGVNVLILWQLAYKNYY